MVATINIVTRCDELSEKVDQIKSDQKTIGLVPTMGALHEGHLSLVRIALQETDVPIVSIYVNPTQFAPHEDLADYPKTFDEDITKLGELGVPVVFAPSDDEIYPDGFSTLIQPPKIAHALEGESRPSHFQGVATIVLKLLNLTRPDAAFFGQKDFQQSLVIRRMVQDLNFATKIRVCPIVRDSDNLAMSSRNVYLSRGERQQALSLSQTLEMVHQRVVAGDRDAIDIMAAMRKRLIDSGVSNIDYAVVARPDDLHVLDRIVRLPVVALIAARVGKTRLIDNRIIP